MKTFLNTCVFLCIILLACETNNSEPASTENTELEKSVSLADNQYLDSLIKENPKSADLYYQRANANFEKGILPAAIADIYSALQLDSSKADYYFFAGDLFVEMGEGTKAIQTAVTGIANLPNNEEMYLRAAEYSLIMHDYKPALNFLNDLLAINKYNAEAYFLKGMIFKEVGDTAKAISSFQTTTEQDPTFYNAYMQLGILNTAQKNDLAIRYFDNALRVDNNSREAMYGKAYYYQKIENFNTAIDLYKEMIARDAKDHQIFYNIGHCYLEMDSFNKAYKNFNIATQIQPSYAGAFYMKGFAAESLGNQEEAKLSYQQALNMLPNNEEIMNALKRVK